MKRFRTHIRTIVTTSRRATIALGRSIARRLEAGDIMFLYGELGSGKTTLTKGIAAGLGVKEPVTSSSFVIASEYTGRMRLSHVDLYRLDGSGISGLPLDEYMIEDGVTVIEWSERLGHDPSRLPRGLHVHISIKGSKKREFVIEDLRH